MLVRIAVESVSNLEQSSLRLISPRTKSQISFRKTVERLASYMVVNSVIMTTHCASRSPVHNFLATVVLVAAAVLIFSGGNSVVDADEFPTFFLKAAKSVPRIGRRSGTFDDFFMKAAKSVPRIGRRGSAPASLKTTEAFPWYPKHPADLSNAGGDDLWSAENYARAMEQSPELWEMITANGAAEAPTAAGFNSEVWQREKRTGSEQAAV